MTLPAGEQFETLLTSAFGDALRGVAFAPCGPVGERGVGMLPDRSASRMASNRYDGVRT